MNKREYTFDENIVSDLHKDAYGSRPGERFWAEWSLTDNDGKQRMWDALLDDLGRAIENEREYQQQAIAEFESWVAQTMSIVFNSTREDCIRMMHDAHDTRGDVEYLEHCLGVPYGYLSGRKPGWLV